MTNIILGDAMNIIPTVIEKNSNKDYAYDLYSRLLKDRIIFINGEINNESANILISELLYLDSLNNEEINIYINKTLTNLLMT